MVRALRAAALCSVALILACPGPGTRPLRELGAGVRVRPDGSPVPEPCPAEALQAMRLLQLRPGYALDVEIDANQIQREPLTVLAGPIESINTQPMRRLDVGTRLYGWIWTTGRGVVIRYYRAQMVGGDVFPICAVARRGGDELAGTPGKWPNSVELQSSSALAFIVEEFL